METNAPSESKSYRAMLEEIEKILGKISAEDIDLDILVAEVEQGYGLIKNLRLRLAETRNKIENLRLDYEHLDDATPQK
jgi:exodeoxyribonuclease VII small subunit